MKKVAVLVEDHYQVLEVWYPYLHDLPAFCAEIVKKLKRE